MCHAMVHVIRVYACICLYSASAMHAYMDGRMGECLNVCMYSFKGVLELSLCMHVCNVM